MPGVDGLALEDRDTVSIDHAKRITHPHAGVLLGENRAHPTTTQRVQVRCANSTMGNPDIGIGLVPSFRPERLILHWGRCICSHPTMKHVLAAPHRCRINFTAMI